MANEMGQLQVGRFWGHRWKINRKAKSSARDNACVLSPLVMSDSLQLYPARLHFPSDSRQEYSTGLPFLSPGDLPDPGIEPMSFKSPVLTGGFFTMNTNWFSTKVEFSAWAANLHYLGEWSVWHQDGDSAKDWGQLCKL